MERMSVIPGKDQQGYFHHAKGHLVFDQKTAVEFANEFIIGQVLKNHDLYSTMLSALNEGEQIDIYYGLRGPAGDEEKFADGELVGQTVAKLTDKDGNTKTLFEVGRSTTPVPYGHAVRAFNAYRDALTTHYGDDKPTPLPIPEDSDKSPVPTISRALSPSNLFYSSTMMWYFMDMSMAAPSADTVAKPMELSKPMSAQDAIILSALMTAAHGVPPFVFGVFQSIDLGQVPNSFRTGTWIDGARAPGPDEIVIIC